MAKVFEIKPLDWRVTRIEGPELDGEEIANTPFGTYYVKQYRGYKIWSVVCPLQLLPVNGSLKSVEDLTGEPPKEFSSTADAKKWCFAHYAILVNSCLIEKELP